MQGSIGVGVRLTREVSELVILSKLFCLRRPVVFSPNGTLSLFVSGSVALVSIFSFLYFIYMPTIPLKIMKTPTRPALLTISITGGDSFSSAK